MHQINASSLSDAPLIRVEHLARIISTRAQTTTILDDITFGVPAACLLAINGP